MGIEGSGSIEIYAIDLQSSLMLCLAWLKTSRGPTKSRASMPGCSVNNTLMIGMESVVAMVATEWLLRCSVVRGELVEQDGLMLLMLLQSRRECAWTTQSHTR
jgi:hypothetical protein